MGDARGIRRAVRALVMDKRYRALLVRLEFPTWQGSVVPGGGVEDGEDDIVTIRRELAEEVGLVDTPDHSSGRTLAVNGHLWWWCQGRDHLSPDT